MLDLFILMMERVGLIILLAFLLVNVSYFKRLLLQRQRLQAKIWLILIFGIFVIISNFTGIEITDNRIIPTNLATYISGNAAIANTRTLTISGAGLIGGPVVGTLVGLIGGVHRVIQGNGQSAFYILSSILVGFLAGFLGQRIAGKTRFVAPWQATIIGVAMETIQMTFVLFFSGSLAAGWQLVQLIGVPMILLNSIGTFTFMSIITATLKQEEQAKAVQTHDVLELAAATLPYFREGLNEASSYQVAQIIHHYTHVSAISITDTHQILAHVGAGSDHHIPEKEVITELSRRVLQTGKMTIAHNRQEIGCTFPNCPLQAAIVIPLYVQEHIAGTLKMYFTDARELTPVAEKLAEGLGSIFSSQIELGVSEVQSKLLKEVEIKSLQSQVNPHFFFNAINTISALIRVNQEQARKLLLELSNYFRGNLQGARMTLIPLTQELKQVEAYLSLEQARFPDRYQISQAIPAELTKYYLPPYAIQILVENAIKHAFGNRKDDNQVNLVVTRVAQQLVVDVTDNGHGIAADKLDKLGQEAVASEKGTGTALENLARRLDNLFGAKAQFIAENTDTGAHFQLRLPLVEQQEVG
ncbi:MAG: sensor histidine kinase [Lactobacillus sp.]|jgi:two-component system sensor histidine kinase LytS|nr:sensor histidine kinase [Lactobacillus sp.]